MKQRRPMNRRKKAKEAANWADVRPLRGWVGSVAYVE